MTLEEFNALFEEHIEIPLGRKGFDRYRKTKSLILTLGNTQVSLIRLGGRLARPGCVTQIICFRHKFLRPIDAESPVEFTLEPSDYPFKLRLRNFSRFAFRRPKYRPMNLGLREVDRYGFEEKTSQLVRRDLTKQKDRLLDKVLPWSARMDPAVVAEQIRNFGEGAWCEKRWIEDYDKHLADPTN